MASSENKEDGQCTFSGGSHHQATRGLQSPASATGYPATMGYPAPMGYPPGYYNSGGPPPHPPPLGLQGEQERIKKISGIFRGIISGLIFFFLLGCVISIITWLILHPTIPIFHVNSLDVSDFKISPSPNFLTGNFVANITTRNPNQKLVIEFYDIDVFMVYNNEYLVGASTGEPFDMNKKENVTMELKLSAANNVSQDSDEFRSNVMREIATERSWSGKVRFEMRMHLWGSFKSGQWWTRHALIKVFCEDIEIGFLDNNSTNGTFKNANSNANCLVG